MTDHLSISKQLALAIGWKPKQLGYGCHHVEQCIGIPERIAFDSGESRIFYDDVNGNGWCVVFDYRDEVIAFRVAQRYNCFPYAITDKGARTGQWNAITRGKDNIADTPQLAIAMAVINGANK